MSDKKEFKTLTKKQISIVAILTAIVLTGVLYWNFKPTQQDKINAAILKASRETVKETKTTVGPKFTFIIRTPSDSDFVYRPKEVDKFTPFLKDALKAKLVKLNSKGEYMVIKNNSLDMQSGKFLAASYKFKEIKQPHIKFFKENGSSSFTIKAYPYISYDCTISKTFQHSPMNKYVPVNVKAGAFNNYLVLDLHKGKGKEKSYFYKSSECSFPGKSIIKLPEVEQRIDSLQNLLPNYTLIIVIVFFVILYFVFFRVSNAQLSSRTNKFNYLSEKCLRLITVLVMPLIMCIFFWDGRGVWMYAIEKYSTEIILFGIFLCFYLFLVKIALKFSNKVFNLPPKKLTLRSGNGTTALKEKSKESGHE